MDAAGGDPVAGTAVTLESEAGDLATSVADSAGWFVLRVPSPGAHHLRAERLGYRTTRAGPVEVPAGRTVVVELRLSAEPLELSPLTVVAERLQQLVDVGFYERERTTTGRFITATDIERRRPFATAHLLESMPGVTVLGDGWPLMRQGIGMGTGRFEDICWPRVVVDGLVVSPGGTGSGPGPRLDDLARPADIAGVEVYRSAAAIPVELGGAQSACGVIVIWTWIGR